MSRTSLKVVGPKYIRQVLDARFSFFGSNSQWRLPSDSVKHATRYTAKHKLIAVCRATSVIYRQPTQPTQPTEPAESVAHNKETKRTHTHTHTLTVTATRTRTQHSCAVCACVCECVCEASWWAWISRFASTRNEIRVEVLLYPVLGTQWVGWLSFCSLFINVIENSILDNKTKFKEIKRTFCSNKKLRNHKSKALT